MKAFPVSLCVLSALMLGGCQTTQSLQTEQAQLARALMAEHCVVGRMRTGGPRITIYVREGVVSRRAEAIELHYRNKMRADRITVHSIKDLQNEWAVVDASSQRVRENFYFNRSTGAFACSQSEWKAIGGGNLNNRSFKTAPSIAPSMDHIE